MTGLDLLKQQFNGHVAFRERRPGVLQVLAPLFHEDGDMVDIFLDEPVNGSGKVRIGDHGLTLMRLPTLTTWTRRTSSASSTASCRKTGFRNRTGGCLSKPNPNGCPRRCFNSRR